MVRSASAGLGRRGDRTLSDEGSKSVKKGGQLLGPFRIFEERFRSAPMERSATILALTGRPEKGKEAVVKVADSCLAQVYAV